MFQQNASELSATPVAVSWLLHFHPTLLSIITPC